jgi:cobyrinic acid a,c-diamide synthase
MGLARALLRRGHTVACFKTGPDYIDTDYLSRASGHPAGNLDTWLMSEDHIKHAVDKVAAGCDIVLIEGVRSLYDGATPLGDEGSTAHVAKLLKAPVVLVMNVRSLSRGAAALALGFQQYDRDVDVKGYILNMVKGPTHYLKATSAIWNSTNKRIYGSILRQFDLAVRMRHLGLITTMENDECDAIIEHAADVIERSVDVDGIYELACTAPELDVRAYPLDDDERQRCTVAIAYDNAFSFLYHENLEALRSFGATIKFISPLHDTAVPEGACCTALIGGFPECHTKTLEANTSFMKSLRKMVADGMPLYAECGGLLYLGRTLCDLEGRSWQMTGILDIEGRMHETSQSISYSLLESRRNSIASVMGSQIRGHEFHYSSIETLSSDIKYAYDVRRGRGIDGRHDGIIENNVLAQYSHIHMASQRNVAERICMAACEYSRT